VRAYLQGQASEIRNLDWDLAAFILTTSVEAITHQALRDHADDFEVEKLSQEIVALIVGYLSPPPDRSRP
jgi:hypothetical protein